MILDVSFFQWLFLLTEMLFLVVKIWGLLKLKTKPKTTVFKII